MSFDILDILSLCNLSPLKLFLLLIEIYCYLIDFCNVLKFFEILKEC